MPAFSHIAHTVASTRNVLVQTSSRKDIWPVVSKTGGIAESTNHRASFRQILLNFKESITWQIRGWVYFDHNI